VSTCVMAAALTYGLLMDGFSSCFDPRARWMQVAITDFAIDVSLIGAWFFYLESGWIIRLLYIITVFLFGSAVICGYIVMLLFKLTPEESSKDPIYFVLVRRQKRDDMGYKRAPSVVTARVIVAALGCLMIGAI
nr:hypothetical protein CTI12_AA052090 [Tanacetum cinerariifolium]